MSRTCTWWCGNVGYRGVEVERFGVAEAQLQDKTRKGNTNMNGKLVDTKMGRSAKLVRIIRPEVAGLSGRRGPDYPACSQAIFVLRV